MITFEEVYGNANCGDHPLQIPLPVGIKTIYSFWRGDGGYETEQGDSWDNESFAIGELGGRFYVVQEWSDSSGHGCRCDGTITEWASLEEAIRLGIGEPQREAISRLNESQEAPE